MLKTLPEPTKVRGSGSLQDGDCSANEDLLLELINQTNNPQKAMEMATKILIYFLAQLQSCEEPNLCFRQGPSEKV